MGEFEELKNPNCFFIKELGLFFVRIIGLEPTRLAAPDPKSGMSTNFTISAQLTHYALILKRSSLN